MCESAYQGPLAYVQKQTPDTITYLHQVASYIVSTLFLCTLEVNHWYRTTLKGTINTSAHLISTVGFFTNKRSQSDSKGPQAKYLNRMKALKCNPLVLL